MNTCKDCGKVEGPVTVAGRCIPCAVAILTQGTYEQRYRQQLGQEAGQ